MTRAKKDASSATAHIPSEDATSLLQQRADLVSTRAMLEHLVIVSDEQCASVMELAKQIAKRTKEIDEKHKSFTGKLNEVVKDINGFFNPAIKEGEACRGLIERAVSAYKLKQEEVRRQAIAQVEQAAMTGAPVTQALAVAEAAQDFRMQGVSTKDVYDVEVVDINAVPAEFLVRSVNMDLVVEAFKQGYAVPGVVVHKRKALHMR